MSGGIGYELVIVTGVLVGCLVAVAVLAGVNLGQGRRRWVVLAGAAAYWGLARLILDTWGSSGVFIPLVVGPVPVAVLAIAIHRFR